MDYSKYVNHKTVPFGAYDEKQELKQLKKLLSLSPAQTLRVQELEQIIEECSKKMQEFRQEEDRLFNLWKSDLYAEYGVTNNPKVEQAFQLAWDFGHACGYEEVERYFMDFAELIK